MESLVHCKSLLLSHHATSDLERDTLSRECLGLLEQLKGVDPFRRKRYEELGESGDTLSLLVIEG